MPDFDLDAALSAPADPERNRTGQCVCGRPKVPENAYCLACLDARLSGWVSAMNRLHRDGVRGLNGVCAFAVWMWSKVGMGFHPDTPIGDYINLDTGEPTFSAEEMQQAEEWRQRAFAVADDDTTPGGAFDIYYACHEAQMGYARGILRAAGKDATGTMVELWQALCELGDPQGPPN